MIQTIILEKFDIIIAPVSKDSPHTVIKAKGMDVIFQKEALAEFINDVKIGRASCRERV